MMLEEMGFNKEDLKESFFVTIAPYIFAAYRLQRALRNASTGIKYMNRSQSIRMTDQFIGPPKPYRFGDPDFVGPGPGTMMKTNRLNNLAKQLNMDPENLGMILGGSLAVLVLILAFTVRREIAAVVKYVVKKLKEVYGKTKAVFKKALSKAEEKKLEKALAKQVA
jgi:hypothetical protein